MSEEFKTCPHCGKELNTKKSKRFAANLDFIIDYEMSFVFATWCKGKSKKYKNQIQVEAGYKKLLKLSGANPMIATEIIENSLAANWEGLFPLKNKPVESKPNQETDNRSSFDRLQEKYGR